MRGKIAACCLVPMLAPFIGVIGSSSAEVGFTAYRLRLAHGKQPSADPYSVAASWQVKELAFTVDPSCQSPLAVKKAISSAGESKAALAFDGDMSTQWQDVCLAGEDAIDRCKESFSKGAWIGAELESQSDVRCILVDQTTAVDGLLLDGWSSATEEWIALQEFVSMPKVDGSPIQLRRLLGGACGDPSVDNVVLGSQVWVPSCLSASQWRFTAMAATKSWAVFEVEFHKDLKCRSAVKNGVPMTSDDQPEPARRSHDGVLSTAWTASCTEGAGKGPCDKEQLWVGSSFPRVEDVSCVRIFQSHEAVDKSAGEFSLSMWDGATWVVNQEFSSVSSGVWSQLSPQSQAKSSQWRLANQAKSESAWAVHELEFMRDPMCSERISGGLALSSTIDGAKAFDDNKDTVWVSQCAPCEPSRAYLGQSFEVPVLVRCIQLWQGGDTDYMIKSAALEMWDNSTGSGFFWRQIRIFGELIEGLNQLSPWWQASGTRWRVRNLDAAVGGWRVAELRLFSDEDCAERINGMAFGSDRDPADAERAFDADVTTFWHASCCAKLSTDTECLGCDGEGAWVGLISLQNTTVNCLQIIQGGRKHRGSAIRFAAGEVILEGWDGFGFKDTYEWKNVPGDDWIELVVGVDNDGGITCKDNSDWELCNATGYNCSRYREEDMCNETYQGDTDCGGVEMSFACKESCCLCGSANAGHCPKEAEEDAGLPIMLISLAAGLGSVFLISLISCCVGWKRRSCHHRPGFRTICHFVDRVMSKARLSQSLAGG